jgi:ubiquinone/menaquinone biosynthesis C-methylase UbiE
VEKSRYIIRGGIEGRERLRIISRVMRPTTLALLERAGLRLGLTCLEVACGGGDVAFDMARIVGAGGHIVATDLDQTKVDIARCEAEDQGLDNIEFRVSDIMDEEIATEFDLVHARFLLTHLSQPAQALTRMRRALRPGGTIVVEDVDFRGHFCHPDCPALWQYVDLYTRTLERRGGDANIGPRLPGLLNEAGFENVRMNVVQPAGVEGELKLIAAITMENVAEAIVGAGLASHADVDRATEELYQFAHTPGTVISLPRIVEAWARAV